MPNFIQTYSPEVQKLKVVVYGASGSGKTHFSATAPKPYFVNAENGLLSAQKVLKARGEEVQGYSIKTVQDLRDVLGFLKSGDHPFQTIVVDSISEINEIIKENIEKTKGRSMQLQDWGDLAKTIKSILRGFRDLDMHVIFLAQESIEKDDQTIQRIVPMLNGKAATEIAYFMDIVAYSTITKEGDRKMITGPNPKLLTKDRSGLLIDVESDFSQWVDAICSDAPVVAKPKPEVVQEQAPAKRWAKGVKALYQEVEILMGDFMAYVPNVDASKWEQVLLKRIENDFACAPIDLTLDQVKELHTRIQTKLDEAVAQEEKEMSKGGAEVLQADGTVKKLSKAEIEEMFTNTNVNEAE